MSSLIEAGLGFYPDEAWLSVRLLCSSRKLHATAQTYIHIYPSTSL